MPHCFSWWMNGISHRALFLFQGFSREKSKQTLSLVTLFFMAQPLLLTPEDLTRPSWHSLFSLCSKSSYCQCQTAEVPQRAPRATAQQKLLSPPSRLTRSKPEPQIPPHHGQTQRNPPASPPHTQQACQSKLLPHARHSLKQSTWT